MKKTMINVAGALVLAAGMLLASCTTDASNINSQIDTVNYLSAPVVKATAYPGMNYVSWSPVANANGYVVYKYEDGNFINSKSSSAAVSSNYNVLDYADTDVRDGAEYTYYVEATSKTSSGRAVVTENKMSEPVSVKGIVPAYSTKSLELSKFEAKADTAYDMTSANINVAKDGFNKLSVAFPGKAYLTYAVSYSIDNENETTGNVRSSVSGIYDRSANDKTLYTNTTLTTSGKYTVYVTASAANSHFGTSDAVASAQTVTVEKLETSADAAITAAAYTDAGKTVRVVFTPAVLSSGAKAPVSYCKVYRSTSAAPYSYTAVSGTVKAANSKAESYYVEDEVTDSTVTYIYTVVTANNGLFASAAPTKNVSAYAADAQSDTTVSGTLAALDSDASANVIVWTITLPSTDVAITGVYTLVKDASYTTAVVAADFDTTKESLTASKTLDTTDKVYRVSTKENYTVGQKVYMLVKTAQAGKADGEWISDAVSVTAASISASQAASKVEGAAEALDTDGIENDIAWTITLPSADVKISAVYVLETDASAVTASDFDSASAVEYTSATDVTQKVFMAYTRNHTVGKKVYMMVMTSETGKAVTSYICEEPVSIAAPSVSDANLSITASVYDNSVTGATNSTAVKDDVIINVKDVITDASDSIDNYTYTVYKAVSTESTDTSTITWNFSTAEWKQISSDSFKMEKNSVPSSGSTTTEYVGIIKDPDLDDGVYGYRVVKSNKYGKVTKIDYAQVQADKRTISYCPVSTDITATWKDVTQATSNIVIKFTKDEAELTPVNGTGALAEFVVKYTNEEKSTEDNVTLKLYRAVYEASATTAEDVSVVWTLVTDENGAARSFAAVENKVEKDIYYKNDSDVTVSKKEPYVDSITYSMDDVNLSTGNSYAYMVVAEYKDSVNGTYAEIKTSGTPTKVAGKN